jgi:hypothetical protein
MYTVRWFGFGVSQALTKSVLHFFPTSSNVSAPYPLQCKIEIFSEKFGRKSLILDGARLHQPDGIKLEAAFPVLEDGAHPIFGVTIELSAQAQRVDIRASQVYMEVINAGSRVRFRMKQSENIATRSSTPLLFKDENCYTSLAVVNGSVDQITVDGLSDIPKPIPGESVVEVEPSDNFYEGGVSFETDRTTSLFRGIAAHAFTHPDRALFVIQRDQESKKIQSIYSVGV